MNTKQISEWFLTKESLQPRKLQQLLYYSYVWYLVFMNESQDEINNRLFDEDIVAWANGPVVQSIYDEYKKYRFDKIPQIFKKSASKEINDDELNVLEQVWNVYGKITSDELGTIIRQEYPYIEARKGLSPLQNGYRNIKDNIIFDYYSQKLKEEQ